MRVRVDLHASRSLHHFYRSRCVIVMTVTQHNTIDIAHVYFEVLHIIQQSLLLIARVEDYFPFVAASVSEFQEQREPRLTKIPSRREVRHKCCYL